MRVAVTGTPGTGKTTAVAELEASGGLADADLDVVHLNDAIEPEGLYDERDAERDSLIVDLDAIREYLADRDDVLVESHLAHHVPADRVVVLRCRPTELERRLVERGESEPKARENAESEALDVILAEAVEAHGRDSVYEVETTDRSPDAVAEAIAAVIAGEREPSAGTVDYTTYL